MRSSPYPLFLAAAGALLAACTSTPPTIVLRSLEASDRTSFVCLGGNDGPRNINDCPDQVPFELDHEDRHLYTLVTQKNRGEVALVDLTLGAVVDQDPTIPGFNFLPVGAQPTSIVSTPGSVASFVGVAELGREGIFALPSSCITQRKPDEALRDLTSWPACRLPSAPGDMALLIDPPIDADGDPSTPPVVRESCAAGAPAYRVGAEPVQPPTLNGKPLACPADLTTETVNPGRRKLAVALPARGEVAIIDAQALLNRVPGTYDPCPIESYLKLSVDLPSTPIPQKLPPDLDVATCPPTSLEHGPESTSFTATPSGFSQLDDPVTAEHRLFVADRNAPVIHVINTENPCAVQEEPPLLPMSFVDPSRIVLTSKVAVSPLTSDQKRYLYAIDDLSGGSVMIFDVSPGATDRTPILRPRSSLLPFEPPDRIAFNSPARDVTFGLTDTATLPDPQTGTQSTGILCDPDPALSTVAPGALLRPATDLSTGARPALLRGVFGFVALASGQVSVVDVEDLDRECRRPIYTNRSATEDFRGCSSDPGIAHGSYYTVTPQDPTAVPTVTNEVSCQMVETNRTRSSLPMRNDSDVGVRAPSLRSFPVLVSKDGRNLVTDRTLEGLKSPHMLGVNFSASAPAQVFVGTTNYVVGDRDNPLVVDPAGDVKQSSVVLSFAEPRAYAPDEVFSAQYEGSLFGERPVAEFSYVNGVATLTDTGIVFCDRGVEDQRSVATRVADPATRAGIRLADADVPAFASGHADYARITNDILTETNTYWTDANSPGRTCGGADGTQADSGFLNCQTQFGTHDDPTTLRDLRILQATRNVLTVEPRHATTEHEKDLVDDFITCCFPQTVSYEVRASSEWIVRGSASGFRHDITTSTDGQCVPDCNPLRAHLRSRALEMSCSDGCGAASDGQPIVGKPAPSEVACVFDAKHLPPQTIGDPGSACLFQGLTTNFAIYGGQHALVAGTPDQPASQVDMAFSWEVIGGFSPLAINLSALGDANTLPQSMVFSPQLKDLVIADGASKGLVIVDLSTFALSQYY